MAKTKNEDYIRDARAIVDRLEAVEGLNVSSAAILNACKTSIEENDGRFAFTLASRANFMHEYCSKNM